MTAELAARTEHHVSTDCYSQTGGHSCAGHTVRNLVGEPHAYNPDTGFKVMSLSAQMLAEDCRCLHTADSPNLMPWFLLMETA
jgi:hypothetical protein